MSCKSISSKNEFSLLDRSDKGSLPYITLNGVDVADSHIDIDYLSKKLGRDRDSELTLF